MDLLVSNLGYIERKPSDGKPARFRIIHYQCDKIFMKFQSTKQPSKKTKKHGRRLTRYQTWKPSYVHAPAYWLIVTTPEWALHYQRCHVQSRNPITPWEINFGKKGFKHSHNTFVKILLRRVRRLIGQNSLKKIWDVIFGIKTIGVLPALLGFGISEKKFRDLKQ